MRQLFLHTLSSLFLGLMLTGCTTGMDEVQPTSSHGSFTLGLSADSLAVEMETRAGRDLTEAERQTFTISLIQNDNIIWSGIPYADITQTDCTQPVGEGYVVSAEDCSATEAESANSGWGRRRYRGQSATFSIRKDENTPVNVDCRMANAGLRVHFSESFATYFTQGYSVTTDDRRNLRFDATTADDVAYYNTDTDTHTHTMQVIIAASAGWDGTVRLTRNITLQAGRITRLNVVYNEEGTSGQIGISITIDNEFTNSDEDIIIDENN